LLEKGKLLILLDGLDEVPTSQIDSAIEKIQDFVDRYDKNRLLPPAGLRRIRVDFGGLWMW
jgi:predicted NACHT family NTPase